MQLTVNNSMHLCELAINQTYSVEDEVAHHHQVNSGLAAQDG